jgi:hypothetical protein
MTHSRFSLLLKERILQSLLPPAAAWSLLLLFAEEVGRLQRLNPFHEGTATHHLFETAVDWPLPVLTGLLAAVWLLRRWPVFLRLRPAASVAVTLVRILVHGTLLFAAVTIGTVVIGYLLYDPATDPQGQFHIWVWAGGLLHAAALAPLAALLTVWWASRRKRGITG